MKALVCAATLAALAPAARAEMRNEEHAVGDRMVKIAVVDTLEIMTVGPSEQEQVQVLSGADVEIVLFAGDPDSVALVGQPVLVAEVTGTHSCEAGDPRAYWVVTLGEPPVPEGPLTTCEELVPSVTAGQVVLEADPMGEGAFWAWAPGKGWTGTAE